METATKSDIREVLMKIANLQREMNILREHVEDIALSADDIRSLEDAERDFREGKTISLENLEKELRR